MILRNNRGFSLLEIMIAAGALGILSAMIMGIVKISGKSSAKLAMDSDVTLTVNEIYAILADPERCRLTFDGTAAPESIVSEATPDASTPPVYTATAFKYPTIAGGADGGFGNSNFRISSYLLTTVASETVLLVEFKNKQILKGKTGPDTFTKRINMYVEGPLGGVTTCRSLSSADTDVWSRGEGSKIFYSGGNVGIETDDPSATLDVVGDIFASSSITAATFLYNSDRRLKKNVELINNPVQKILSLRGVTFDWRNNDKHDFGFIAQEVQELIPEIVRDDSNRGLLTVDYAKIIPILVEAIKRQQVEIDQLKKEINNSK
ncbi:MAG: prepilin-type N-terminal cleavage/methylation domain-containing protein [Bdellovibrionales bacterium]|jgi:prepilin-type N-terminal cleavage/methylation domain-containing protein|nr:prepilin-type N-terminal cleavage/methylation domain-containing protein [Bdellovibrionales bacterium]MBT3527010.1 prepilin-type N-terminal cleavage/methylation domain-containing protein [Bdellovibrionales bacterium]MBT7669515.1 prepilin-type N-terminal cleavage/methylation domain-containing protein [Bdellovibrionales bacterium]